MLNTAYTLEQSTRIADLDNQREIAAREAAITLIHLEAAKTPEMVSKQFEIYKAHKAKLDELSERIVAIMCE